MSYLKKRLTPNRVNLFSSLLVICLVTLFFTPALVFQINGMDFNNPFVELMRFSIKWAGLALLLIISLNVVLSEKVAGWIAPLFAYLAISGFLMGVYISPMIVDVGLIDGTANAFITNKVTLLGEGVISSTILLGFYVFFAKIRKVLQDILFVAVILILGFTSYIAFTDYQLRNTHAPEVAGRDDFFRLSEQENVLVFLFDTLSSEFLVKLINEDPELANKLNGFTLFRDTISVSPTTYLAMPSIHSGEYLDPNKPILDQYNRLVAKQSFLTKAANKGADAVLLNTIVVCPDKVTCTNSSAVILNSESEKVLEWGLLVDISLFRLLPYAIKPKIFNDGEWLIHHDLQESNPLNVNSIRDNQVMIDFADNIFVQGEKPQIKFIHLFNTHYPFNQNENCELVVNPNNNAETRLKLGLNAARCAIDRFAKIIDALKDLGVYEKSLLAVISDHGANVGLNLDRASSSRPDKIQINDANNFFVKSVLSPAQKENRPKNVYSASATFSIKPPMAKGPFQEDMSHAVSLMDFPTTLCNLTQLCEVKNGFDAFNAPEAQERLRPYNEYKWQTWFWGADDLKGHVTKKEIDFSLVDAKQTMKINPIFDFSQVGYSFAGFGSVEEWGRWSNGYKSALQVCIKSDAIDSYNLVFEVKAFLSKTIHQQRVKVLTAGNVLTEAVFSFEKGRNTYSDLRVSLAGQRTDADGCIDLVFEFPDATIPNIENSKDKRLLAIGFKAMRIEQTTH